MDAIFPRFASALLSGAAGFSVYRMLLNRVRAEPWGARVSGRRLSARR